MPKQFEVRGFVKTPYGVVINDEQFPSRSVEDQEQLIREELALAPFQNCTVERIDPQDDD